MRECSVKRGEIISRQTKSTKLSGFQFIYNLIRIFIDQNRFLADLSKTLSQCFITCFLMAVRYEVNLQSSVVVQELEFAINRALYGLL